MTDIDVLVIGAGAAGLTAALTAHEQGARVVVAEAERIVGGAARLSGGLVMAAGTEVQRAAGLEDDASSLYREYMLINQYEPHPALAWRLAMEAGAAVEWLMTLGVRFPEVVQGGGERVPRSHRAGGGGAPGGQHIIDVLAGRCRELGIEIAVGNRVDRLRCKGATVVGARAGGEDVHAAAVVIASGGFGSNSALIERYLPTYARNAAGWSFYMGSDSSRGDAFAFAEQVGAHIVGHDRYVALLGPHVEARDFDAYPPAWSVVVGPDGRRLMDETLAYGVTFGLVNAAGGRAFVIFDEAMLVQAGSPELPTFKSSVPPNVWSPDGIARLLASGAIVRESTIERLAGELELPAATLAGTISRYNESAALGEDRDFRKERRFLRALDTAPYYGAEIRPTVLGITACGLEIDVDARVLDEVGRPIPGLFAAGECTGGVIGPRYVGSGNGLASCLTFGRTAGGTAAAHASTIATVAGAET